MTGFSTRAIHAGEGPDPATRAHTTPIHQTATFSFETAAEKDAAVDAGMRWEPGAFFYSRTALGNVVSACHSRGTTLQ